MVRVLASLVFAALLTSAALATPIYAITDNGDILLYNHAGTADGPANWPVQGKNNGHGWNFKQVFAGDNGAIYAITESGDMLFYKHAGTTDGASNWPIQAKKTWTWLEL